MKTNILLTLITLTILAFTLQTQAQQNPDENDIWTDPPQNQKWHPSPEMLERFLDRIEENDPQKAQQLREMQNNDPQAFQQEIREMMKLHMRQRFQQRPPRDSQERPERNQPRQQRSEQFRDRMQQEKQLFEQWLQENYPQQAINLEKLQDTNPELYRQELMETIHQYGRLYRAEKDNPQLAEILKQDMLLKQKEADLVDLINDAETENEKQTLTNQLQQVLSQRFDIIIQRKQLQTEQMQQKLIELQQQLDKKQQEIQTLQTRKQQEIQSRIQNLLSTQQQLQWD